MLETSFVNFCFQSCTIQYEVKIKVKFEDFMDKPDTMDKLNVGNDDCSFIDICSCLSTATTAGLLYRKWKKLAVLLNISEELIFSIENRLSNEVATYLEALHEILVRWRTLYGSKATLHELVLALEQLQLNELADQLRIKFTPSTQPSHHQNDYQKLRFLRIVGKITYDTSKKLGESQKAIVYKGHYQDHDAAVKKMAWDTEEDLWEQIKATTIQKSIGHPNIVKFYLTETDENFTYIALEFCHGNLADWMNNQIAEIKHCDISSQEVLRQITEGVAHLHAKDIIHQNLKPTNILLVLLDNQTRTVRVKIEVSRPSSTETSGSDRTTGWKAPEVLRNQTGVHDPNILEKPAVDIFSLGCIFYYVLSGGNHPFGNDPASRDHDIFVYKTSLDVNHFTPLLMGNLSLLEHMIAEDRSQRPAADYILGHHIFWSQDKMMSFISDINKIFENVHSKEIRAVRRELEQNFSIIAENCSNDPEGWLSLNRQSPMPGVCPVVQNYLINGPSKYSGKKIVDLYRAIYNLDKHKYNTSFPQNVKMALGPGNHLNYWLPKFPFLVSTLWTVCQSLPATGYNIEKYYTK